ncbi:laminin subunit alpha [Aplysia californica]|uniref:Laminin subunit alpha n=1 Tax=Aplysia californica TaxID=6500 RepID=A0ABM0ZU92_APLCA|nr:laminin subunit alpha [Aplysia californica]
MELLFSIGSLLVLSTVAVANEAPEGPCFQFPGDSYIHFTPNNFINDGSVHYRLTFRTTSPNGIILYARGIQDDDEALFLREGKLAYHLYNAGPAGLGRYFGGYFQTEENVNTGDWVTVNVYRVWAVLDQTQRRFQNQTGIVVEIGDRELRHVDHLDREDIRIMPTIYVGGFREPLSDTVGFFEGQIKDIREARNGVVLEEPSLNYMSKVGRTCMIPNPQ